MNKIVQMVIKKFSRSHTQYRFDKISNFLNYEQFCEKEAIDTIISLGKELEIMRKFKKKSKEELEELEEKWHEVNGELNEVPVELHNKFYAKEVGIKACRELERRRSVETKEFYKKQVRNIPHR